MQKYALILFLHPFPWRLFVGGVVVHSLEPGKKTRNFPSCCCWFDCRYSENIFAFFNMIGSCFFVRFTLFRQFIRCVFFFTLFVRIVFCSCNQNVLHTKTVVKNIYVGACVQSCFESGRLRATMLQIAYWRSPFGQNKHNLEAEHFCFLSLRSNGVFDRDFQRLPFVPSSNKSTGSAYNQ